MMKRHGFWKGKLLSYEHKQKMSQSHLGEKNPMYGKKLTKSHRKRLSESHKGIIPWNKGKPMSDITKKKISTSLKGIMFTEERRKNMHSNKGRKLSEEWKRKLREAKIHQVVLNKNTKIETMFKIGLSLRGIAFIENKAILGRPDIFIEPNIAIFCDGDYWHANPNKFKPDDIIKGSRRAKDIWNKDSHVTNTLKEQGYTVYRFWEHDIKKDVDTLILDLKVPIQ